MLRGENIDPNELTMTGAVAIVAVITRAPTMGGKPMHTLLLLILLILSACGDPCAESVDQTFLDHEADQDGAIRTESGLIYRELKEGWGPQPGPKSRVTVHYLSLIHI
mgnify:CR=1 FL=1